MLKAARLLIVFLLFMSSCGPKEEPCPALDIIEEITQVSCLNPGGISLTISNGGDTYNYAWTGPNGFTASTKDISNLEPGTYNVRISDAQNCEYTSSYPLRDPLCFDECLPGTSGEQLEMVTWNIQFLPKDVTTVAEVVKIVNSFDADMIAVQEIETAAAFDEIANNLPGWSGIYNEDDSNLLLGYLYKESEIEVVDSYDIYDDNPIPFPRPPYVAKVRYKNGTMVYFINIHLKAFSGTENKDRRREASRLLKEYIDTNLPDERVVVLGDYNDLIEEPNSVFENLILDSLNYKFIDMDIARGPSTEWSYPSIPSHIDHILVTNELFDTIQDVQTIKLDICDQRYDDVISDHRPLLGTIGF
jgi:endonuclease/exonuclease/phosphatase family metal-dependent hydrolase